jgi:hypothetical protein
MELCQYINLSLPLCIVIGRHTFRHVLGYGESAAQQVEYHITEGLE